MYKALIEIGGYKPGEEVPLKDALIWKDMYLESPVEEVSDDGKPAEESKIPEVPKEEPKEDSSDSMMDDYLARGKNVVCKNLREDNFSKEQLDKLLEMEKSDKKRSGVIKAIEKKLGAMN